MNFFEQQQRVRRQTVVLVLLFIAATLVIVAATNLPILAAFYIFSLDREVYVPFDQWLHLHPRVPLWTTLIAAGLIGGASLYRLLSLSRGGGAVARLLGGARVDPGTRDPQRRQLLNVVEETAIASGLPVPAVYVLETEGGINAFAAGFSPSDAVVAVTRGALDTLTRDELQGVVAHEFSHILHGDTRLNMQLISASFGILVVALTGRMVLRGAAESRDGRAAAIGVIVGFLLLAVGYIGVLASRLIKAAVSRRRELLADASAVQFTRNPHGIAGALKKIAVSPLRAAIVAAEGEEVNHMLIAEPAGLFTRLFASHPPIVERIRLLEPHFDPGELQHIRLAPMRAYSALQGELAPQPPVEAIGLAPHIVIGLVGNPGEPALRTAAELKENLAPVLLEAAHSPDDCVLLMLALVLNEDAGIRRAQLAQIGAHRPAESVARIEQLAAQLARLHATQRLPLMELAFPTLRQRPQLELRALIGQIDELARLDGKTSIFEYALSRLLRQLLLESMAPRAATRRATRKLYDLRDEVQTLFSLLAEAGHVRTEDARKAYAAGLRRLLPYGSPPAFASPQAWVEPLDRALMRLDRLAPLAKQELIAALVTTVLFDRQVTLAESELLRVVCALLHCPLPPLLRDAA